MVLVTCFQEREYGKSTQMYLLILGHRRHLWLLLYSLLWNHSFGWSWPPCHDDIPAALWRDPYREELKALANSQHELWPSWNWMLHSQSSFWITTVPTDILTVTSWESLSKDYPAKWLLNSLPTDTTDITKAYRFLSCQVGVICYVELINYTLSSIHSELLRVYQICYAVYASLSKIITAW